MADDTAIKELAQAINNLSNGIEQGLTAIAASLQKINDTFSRKMFY